MEELKNRLIEMLEAINYNDDKVLFSNAFLAVCHKNAVKELIKELPEGKADELASELENKKYQSLEEGLVSYISKDRYMELFKEALRTNIGGVMDAVLPTLSEDQLSKFDAYLETLKT